MDGVWVGYEGFVDAYGKKYRMLYKTLYVAE